MNSCSIILKDKDLVLEWNSYCELIFYIVYLNFVFNFILLEILKKIVWLVFFYSV